MSGHASSPGVPQGGGGGGWQGWGEVLVNIVCMHAMVDVVIIWNQ